MSIDLLFNIKYKTYCIYIKDLKKTINNCYDQVKC